MSTTTEENRAAVLTDDLYGEMLRAVRAWLDRYHAEAEGVSLYVWEGDALPPTRITLPVLAVAVVG